ncbi:hypothetical protein WCE14_08885 [Acinetobacter schindleri]|uniref:Uncharacterized protein n=1 Tax=Acinetobacter schindleri NIPH 900 TaxID=1217675 RepID=N8WRM2_9GAMM|nr:hypothetical protein [Acinetobacter schindleri]ENV14767.1 hypothetical protein F965_00113 [Acinetobacter schindleri NIPH 900]
MQGNQPGNDLEKLDECLRYGKKQGAHFAFFINGHFWHYYKPGNAESKYCWLFMPVHNQKVIEWKISYNLNLDSVVSFYQGRGYDVQLIKIEQE